MKSRTTSRKTKTRTIVLLGFEGAAALDITGPHEVFALSSRLALGDSVPPYRLVFSPIAPAPFARRQGSVSSPTARGVTSMVRQIPCS